ncbi:serine hydrolase [Aliiglaciecola sp. 3_MG-2023]|uniref:serine hydrolase domain-containing protein n=1 Tax=Aliiglaciecola sp. 3_MG-2023 TaxID=3062644 RepID=UPI0026E2D7FE|nr:serine hydrolase [Aliiglaciecola sp. 3_MG-2023]MDO6693738.1 serine hydrolase [Aliiglaciecola sp. 3_MG-2023]
MSRLIKIVASLCGIILLVALGFLAINYTYISRLNSLEGVDFVHDTQWYEPLVTMQPASNKTRLSISDEALSQQDERFADALGYAEQVGSSAFLVWQNGELLAQKYWKGENADSYMQTFSVQKSMVALLIGIAIERGEIQSVKDPVSKYIGQWIDMPFGEITIEHLLTMSSGLFLPPVDLNNSFSAHSTKLNYSNDISKVARSLEQVKAPGTVFEYNNSNPQLLVDVLEAATGEKFAAYMEKYLWSKVAANPGYVWLDDENGTAHGFSFLIAKPEDLLAVGVMLLNKGAVGDEQVVSQAWIKQTTQPSLSNPNYGYLTWLGSPYKPMRTYRPGAKFGVIHSAPYFADDVIFFDGFGGQRVYIIPSKQLVIVRVGDVRFDFDDAAIPNAVINAVK